MKILIDCGASDGAAIPDLTKQFGPFDKIFAIEANPSCVEALRNKNINNIEILNAAVSTVADYIKLYLGDNFTESSILLSKTTGNLNTDRYVDVESIDFNDWLTMNISMEDTVICKMDIEGAEFDVLEHIISRGGINLINIILIEWHANRFPNKWELRIRRAIIKFKLWLKRIKFYTWR